MLTLKASDVYKKAGISRQLFSKIRCNEDYEPEKSTILALAVGMKLNINETQTTRLHRSYAL